MKKLLGFFSILGITSSLSVGPASAYSENDYDWSTPATVLESISKLVESRVFSGVEEFHQFINTEVFGRYTNIITNDEATFKPHDIVLTYQPGVEGAFNFKAEIYQQNGDKLEINDNETATRIINITFMAK